MSSEIESISRHDPEKINILHMSIQSIDEHVRRMASKEGMLNGKDAELLKQYSDISRKAKLLFSIYRNRTDLALADADLDMIENLYDQMVSVRAHIASRSLQKYSGNLRNLFEDAEQTLVGVDREALQVLEPIIIKLEASFEDVTDHPGNAEYESFYAKQGNRIGVDFDGPNGTRWALAELEKVQRGPGASNKKVMNLLARMRQQILYMQTADPAGPERKRLSDIQASIDCRKGSFDWRFLRMGGTLVAGLLVAFGTGISIKNWHKTGNLSVDIPTVGWAGALALLLNGGLPQSEETQALRSATQLRKSVNELRAAGFIEKGEIAARLLDECQEPERKEAILALVNQKEIQEKQLSGVISCEEGRNAISKLKSVDAMKNALLFFAGDYTEMQCETIKSLMKALGTT